jgi:putative ABC transport system permease protein
MKVYRWLLRLLPKYRRGARAEEMAGVFDALRADERRRRGRLGVAVLWARETVGLMRFAFRERVLATWIMTEFQWALRGIRARGWTAGLAVSLAAIAIAANALVFSASDSLVFNRLTYPNASRLIEIRNAVERRPTAYMTAPLIREWSAQTDLLHGLARYRTTTVFLSGGGTAERAELAEVSAETFSVLGSAPRWGRSFSNEDVAAVNEERVVISEDLATARFGAPARALGQQLQTTAAPMLVVGVMPGGFHFPRGDVRIWRVATADAQPGYFDTLACLAPGRTLERDGPAIAARGEAIARTLGLGDKYRAVASPYGAFGTGYRQMFLLLLGAAACLLLTACANIASLELTSAARRSAQYALQLALGASKGLLARVALIEGAMLAAIAFGLALALASLGTNTLTKWLPERFGVITVNPIDVDARTIGFMSLIVLGVWLVSTLPVVFHASRASLTEALKAEGRSSTLSRAGVMTRRLLTAVEVAAAVLLLVGSALYVRSYSAMIGRDKGFDSTGLIAISLTVPPQMMAEIPAARADLMARIEKLPGVLGVVRDAAPHNDGDTPSPFGDLRIGAKQISPDYFKVMRVPMRAGRALEAGDAPTDVVVDESLARQLWPAGPASAIGATLQIKGYQPYRVVGVAAHVRTDYEGWKGPSQTQFLYYRLLPPPRPSAPRPAPPRPKTGWASRVGGPVYSSISLTVRLDSPDRAPEFLRQVRAMTPKFELTADLEDDLYAEWAEETLLSTRIVGAFGVLSFLVAMAGVYGVMAYLVAGRAREIGIRMALGADRPAVSRLVLASSMRMVLVGVGLGLGAAYLASRWIASQLVDVGATDAVTYLGVAAVVAITAAFATWHPARQAASVDPAISLRAE